jgi:pimeloyl-ACP methyl ester carboxylesterase
LDPTVADKWRPFIELMKAEGLTIHFWPLPGLAKAPKKPLTLKNYVDWLAKKTKHLEKFGLLGHSFGGQLAIRFTKLHPEKVTKLILVDNSGIIDNSLGKVIKRLVFKTVAKIGRKIAPSPQLRRLLYRFSRETDYYQAAPTQRETMSNILMDEIRPDLAQIKTPTLVIWGRNDRITPLEFGRLVADTIPQASLKIIAGARHSAIYTHPQQVVKLVTAFIVKTLS